MNVKFCATSYWHYKTQKLVSNHFTNALVFNDLKIAFLAPNLNRLVGEVVSKLDFNFLGCVFEPQLSRFFC